MKYTEVSIPDSKDIKKYMRINGESLNPYEYAIDSGKHKKGSAAAAVNTRLARGTKRAILFKKR